MYDGTLPSEETAPPSAAEATAAPRLQRTSGRLRLGFRRADGETRLARLYQEGAAKARLPRGHAPGEPEAVVINTAGGLTGGDRMSIEVEAGAATEAAVSSQASEKIYRSSGGEARIDVSLRLDEGAALAWLPQETIIFERGRLVRRVAVEMAADSRLLLLESLILGRQAMGERVTEGLVQESWRVRRASRLVFAEGLRLEGALAERLAGPAILGGACALATLLYVAPDAEDRVESLRAALEDQETDAGASAWNGLLVSRIVAPDGQHLRRRLVAALQALRPDRELPRVWRC